jgi:predicted DNA binding protein
MSVILIATLPASEFVLAETLSKMSAVGIECEQIVDAADGVVMPLVWLQRVSDASVDDVLAEDPTTGDVDCIAEFDDRRLYRMKWVKQADFVVQMLTNHEATILDAATTGRDAWRFRVLYPDRAHLARTIEFCEDSGLSLDVRVIREMEGEPAGLFGLTKSQYEALALAAERGYFDIPRGVSLEDLATEQGISHQALSERIRRGTKALVEDTVVGQPYVTES